MRCMSLSSSKDQLSAIRAAHAARFEGEREAREKQRERYEQELAAHRTAELLRQEFVQRRAAQHERYAREDSALRVYNAHKASYPGMTDEEFRAHELAEMGRGAPDHYDAVFQSEQAQRAHQRRLESSALHDGYSGKFSGPLDFVPTHVLRKRGYDGP
jgi:hypothetical protein